MKKIFIKYNPYKVETEVLINGSESIKPDSKLNVNGKRLQEWIDDLPSILFDEFNTQNFEVTFYGTEADFDDLEYVAKYAGEKGIVIQNDERKIININCIFQQEKGTQHKEKAIEEIFIKIKNGPIEQLKTKRVNDAFAKASEKDFPVNVIATMSAGKSTLINALLQTKLMPSSAEACTQIITSIKDNDSRNTFDASIFNKNNDIIEYQDEITLDKMKKYNDNKEVFEIKMEGDIPFVNSMDTSLVLVDTPGPNNAHNPEHKETTLGVLRDRNMPLVLYIMNADSLRADDDSNLLNQVVESMQSGGKQARDRYIFVINKLDTFEAENDCAKNSIEKVRQYLITKGIENPNIYGLSADLALQLRTSLKDIINNPNLNIVELISKDASLAKKFTAALALNQTEDLHLEQYASLPTSVKEKISSRLNKAISTGDLSEQLLIHTGIISLEEAISLYVNKYARTAKIKNIADSIEAELASAKYRTTLESKILEKGEERDSILKDIELIKNNLNDGNIAKDFEKKINEVSFVEDAKKLAEKIRIDAQSKISEQLGKPNTKLNPKDAESLLVIFSKFVENLETEVKVKLSGIITENICKTKDELLVKYKEKVSSLSKLDGVQIEIDPMTLMEGRLKSNNIDNMLNDLKKTEQVKVGQTWVSNTDKKWYKPWTWFQESGHYRTDYESREYIDQSELATRYFAPIQSALKQNTNAAIDYAREQEVLVKGQFKELFKQLDEDMKNEIRKLEEKSKQEASVGNEIDDLINKKNWLDEIENQLENILAI